MDAESDSETHGDVGGTRRGGLRALALRGSFWTLVGYVLSQAVRFGSTIGVAHFLSETRSGTSAAVLTGTMAMVGVLMQALQLLSDVGIQPSCIQHKEGDHPLFLRTAWTIQVIRGLVLWLAAAAIAIPYARIFMEIPSPQLILVVASSAVLNGFNSTVYFKLQRHVQLARMTVCELIAQVLGNGTMLLWAWYEPTVWALTAPAFITSGVMMVFTHTAFGGPRMKFVVDRRFALDMFHYGKWILVATMLMFLVGQVDLLIVGRFDKIGLFILGFTGMFNYAKLMARTVSDGVERLSGMVLFPVYARLSEQGVETFRHRSFQMRAVILACSLPPLWVLAVFGPLIWHILPKDYEGGAWVLQILSAGTVGTIIYMTIERVLLATGDSFGHMIQLAFRLTLRIVCMAVGGLYAGTPGFIIGIAISDFLSYPVLVLLVRRYGVWLPGLDGVATVTSCAAMALGWMIFGWPELP